MFSQNPEELAAAEAVIKAALKEDIRTGDITTRAVISPRTRSHAAVTAKSAGTLAGIYFCARTFTLLNRAMSFNFPVEEGSPFKKGQRVLEIRGSTAAILQGERTALNLLARMSGIATLTRTLVETVKGTGARILDTRKTMPGLRLLDKYAVRIGGGYNHRFALNDMFLIKENHISAAGSIEKAVTKCRDYRAKHGLDAIIVAEASTPADAKRAAAAGAGRILLDNMKPDEIRETVRVLGSRVELEVSGGITVRNIRRYAETGVDYISVGILTHSAPAADFSLLALS